MFDQQRSGLACSLPEVLDSDTYIVILKNELRWAVDLYFKDFKGVVFQQDGAGSGNKILRLALAGPLTRPFTD